MNFKMKHSISNIISIQNFQMVSLFGKWSVVLMVFISQFSNLNSQALTGLSAKWDNSLREWTVYAPDEDHLIDLYVRWPLDPKSQEWEFRTQDGKIGVIRPSWANDFSRWELRMGDTLVMATQVWPNDVSSWRIKWKDQTTELNLQMIGWNEWEAIGPNKELFNLYPSHPGDIRDWIIEDRTNPKTQPLPVTLLTTFLALKISILRL
jgi:hypothetical protein